MPSTSSSCCSCCDSCCTSPSCACSTIAPSACATACTRPTRRAAPRSRPKQTVRRCWPKRAVRPRRSSSTPMNAQNGPSPTLPSVPKSRPTASWPRPRCSRNNCAPRRWPRRVPSSATAKRYASAAFSVAAESGDFDLWLDTLDELSRIMRMSSARIVFTSPTVAPADKRNALDRLLPDASPVVRNFLHIVADRDRLDQVPGIAEALHDAVNRQRGIVTAEVTTAVQLDAEMERTVTQRLAAYLNKQPNQVALKTRLDPNIIGGVVARVGDRVIDDSVRGRLERLRRAISS